MLERDQRSPRMLSLVRMLWPAYRAEEANANALIIVRSVPRWWLLATAEATEMEISQ